MSRSKEQVKTKTPLHLRLTAEDWEECCKTLNPAEIKVFIWIRASDPYGDRDLEINCSELGKRLGLHKSSISRALKTLDEKQLIEIELQQVSVKQKISNRRLTLLCKEETRSEREKTEEKENVALAQQLLHQRNSRCTSTTAVAPTQQSLHQHNTQSSEPLQQNDSSTPQTLQTYSDFKKTLSDIERENFEKFVREEWKKDKGQEIKSFAAVMRGEHFQEWFQKWNASPKSSDQNQKWANHPKREEWLAQIRQGKPAFIVKGGPKEERKTREEFAKWAEANNLVWGAES